MNTEFLHNLQELEILVLIIVTRSLQLLHAVCPTIHHQPSADWTGMTFLNL